MFLLMTLFASITSCGADASKEMLAHDTCVFVGLPEDLVVQITGIIETWPGKGASFEEATLAVIEIARDTCGEDVECFALLRGCLEAQVEAVYYPGETAPDQSATLKFPLNGNYSASRINQGGDFGVSWSGQNCASNQNVRLLHTGVDLAASAGEPVYAVADGVIKFSKVDPNWGGYIVLEHGGVHTTTYIHVTPLGIPVGKTVARGQQIAVIASGSANFNPHLHFQWRNAPYPASELDAVVVRRGRLPEAVNCLHSDGIVDPAFPEHFADPKTLPWE